MIVLAASHSRSMAAYIVGCIAADPTVGRHSTECFAGSVPPYPERASAAHNGFTESSFPNAKKGALRAQRGLCDGRQPGGREKRSVGAADERENEVRHFVSIAVAAGLLCLGSVGARADYAHAAREHRAFRAGFPPGWPSVCPRGYYARCSPFRCWCVTT